MKKVLLFDAFSLAFRAFYSYPTNLSLSNGEPINAAFGLISMIFQAIDQIHYRCIFARNQFLFGFGRGLKQDA